VQGTQATQYNDESRYACAVSTRTSGKRCSKLSQSTVILKSESNRLMAASRTSPVWQYFIVSATDVSRVSCTICNSSLARGGKATKNSYGTSNLRKHLQTKHATEYAALVASEKQSSSTTSSETTSTPAVAQSTIQRAFDAKRPWDFDDERSRRIHRLVGEMIATDDQPFNMVNNTGMQPKEQETREFY